MTKQKTFPWFGFLISFFIFASPGHAATSSWTFVEKRLIQNGFSKPFVTQMKQVYQPRDFHKVVELNVLLFLRKTNDHAPQANDKKSVEETRAFMSTHQKSLQIAEETYGVPGSVIASLLWIESRHGRNQGRFHVPSVYLSLMQADRPTVIRHLKKNSRKFSLFVTRAQKARIVDRAKSKAQWALEELHAIEKAMQWKWTSVAELRGSFSGAFGMPQFIPSSYARWARAQNHEGAPDLFRPEDSIQSVAFYLADSGWKESAISSQVAALLKYNNSHDYANAILALSSEAGKKLDPKEKRVAL